MHVRFLCIANSIRSQMAEGAFRSLADESFGVSSAGSFSHKVDETAIAVMSEMGVDISSHTSKGLDDWGVDLPKADLVVDLTIEAIHRERFANDLELIYLNTPLFDPVAAKGLPIDEKLSIYRKCRDAVFKIANELFSVLSASGGLDKIRENSTEFSRSIASQEENQPVRKDDGFDDCINVLP